MSDAPSARRSIEITSFAHSNPIPAATRMGPLLTTSIIPPRDPGAMTTPDDPSAQLENLFHHAGEILAAAGAEWRHVVKMTFFVPSGGFRELINGPWLKRFPDAESRASRHTLVIPGGNHVTCELLAWIED